MEYTLENCYLAKRMLIADGFSEDAFGYADDYDVELGYFYGEPLLVNDDDCVSAFELWKQVVSWSQEDDDAYADFILNKK